MKSFLCAVVLSALAMVSTAHAADALPPLVERLGFPPETVVLILNGDDTGMNQATNKGTLAALKAGGLTSATVMMPCPWAPEVVLWAKENPKANLGLHLTLTSEWRRYKWGPVLGKVGAPSLCNDQGYFYESVPEVYLNAKSEEVEAEVRAQIDKAYAAGLDVTHVDSHMGTLQYAPGYHEMYIKIAKSYDLPCRIAGRQTMAQYGGVYLVDMADEMGVLHPDFLFQGGPKKVEDTERFWKEDCLAKLKPGEVSEVFIHGGQETPEMRSTTGTWKQRTADSDFFTQPETIQWIKDQGIELISYRELRELQRNGKPMARVESHGW